MFFKLNGIAYRQQVDKSNVADEGSNTTENTSSHLCHIIYTVHITHKRKANMPYL